MKCSGGDRAIQRHLRHREVHFRAQPRQRLVSDYLCLVFFALQVALPSVQIDTLQQIDQIISDNMSMQKREHLINGILHDVRRRVLRSMRSLSALMCSPSGPFSQAMFFENLFSTFSQCEDLEMTEQLHLLYNIVKNLSMSFHFRLPFFHFFICNCALTFACTVLLNESALYDILFANNNLLTVIGILEYEPSFSARTKHREFLENKDLFKQVVPIQDDVIVARIHQTFRLQYIKDVILPRALDDQTFASINSLILLNYVEIVQRINDDTAFLMNMCVFADDCQTAMAPLTPSLACPSMPLL